MSRCSASQSTRPGSTRLTAKVTSIQTERLGGCTSVGVGARQVTVFLVDRNTTGRSKISGINGLSQRVLDLELDRGGRSPHIDLLRSHQKAVLSEECK